MLMLKLGILYYTSRGFDFICLVGEYVSKYLQGIKQETNLPPSSFPPCTVCEKILHKFQVALFLARSTYLLPVSRVSILMGWQQHMKKVCIQQALVHT